MITLNNEQRLFVIPSGEGFTCLGFDVCDDWTRRIATELQRDDLLPVASEHGTLEAYARYQHAVDAAQATGKRLPCMLTPELIGLEGKRVEVIDRYGDKRRFTVGKSTGFLPIHLELANSRSSGGMGVLGAPFVSVRVVK